MAIKQVLLGSGASLIGLAGAQAADLPLAEPVEYVKVCSTYGEGFFYIPGTDTCLQISGKVRADYIVLDDESGDAGIVSNPPDASDDDFETDVRGVIALDARSETEWGTLRAYIEFEGRAKSDQYSNGSSGLEADNGDVVGPAVELISAFVQFAGITAGYAPSFYDFVEYETIGDFFSQEDVNTLAYTASFGSGFAATIAIEDKYFRASDDGADNDLDQVWPNVVAALRVDQAWGSAQVSAAVQDNEGDDPDPSDDDIGWAVQAGIKLNVPVAQEGTYIWVQGAYSEGAGSYAGAEDFPDNGWNMLYGFPDQNGTANDELWAVGGGAGIQATEEVRINLIGMYAEWHEGGTARYREVIATEGNIFWTPVDNLDLGVAGLYTHIEAETGEEADSWAFVARIERGF